VYHYVNEPGYYSTHEYVKLESNLYDVDSQNLIWSAATETVDPGDTASAAKELCRALVRDLKARGLVE
jgi:hypothetical protein